MCCCTYICDCGFQFRIKLQPGLCGTSLVPAILQWQNFTVEVVFLLLNQASSSELYPLDNSVPFITVKFFSCFSEEVAPFPPWHSQERGYEEGFSLDKTLFFLWECLCYLICTWMKIWDIGLSWRPWAFLQTPENVYGISGFFQASIAEWLWNLEDTWVIKKDPVLFY